LDESKLPARGAKVRCSRCQHVFRIVPPLEKKEEEIVEDFESFAKSHEEVIDPGLKATGAALSRPKEKKEVSSPGEEKFLLEGDLSAQRKDSFPVSEKAFPLPEEREEPSFEVEKVASRSTRRVEERGIWEEEGKAGEKGRVFQVGKMARRKKRGLSLLFYIFVVLILLIFGAFYLWTELQSGGTLGKYVEGPVKEVTRLWETLWKTERQGLVVRDLNWYEEKVGETSVLVIEGTVSNQSRFTKKYIKLEMAILDRTRTEIANKKVICGPVISREELKKLPPAFFEGELVIKPQTEKETIVPKDKSIPFMVIFKDLSSQPNDWKYQIVEAPNL